MSDRKNFDSFDRTPILNDSSNRFNHQQGYRQEKKLFSLVTTEAYNMHGVPMDYYIVSYDVKYNKIWGEDNDRRFIRKFKVMAYYTLPPEDKNWTKFGIEGLDEFSLFISKRHLRCASVYNNNQEYTRPIIGDIIMANYNKYIYEIVDVKEETQFLQSKQYTWELVVKPFKDEKITTMGTSLSADYIADYTNKDTDIFDIKNDINNKKPSVLYTPKQGESAPVNPWGNW